MHHALQLLFIVLVSLVTSGNSSAVVRNDWVFIGDTDVACDNSWPGSGCYGGVDYEYGISRTEVSNAQYTEFLNAVGAEDPHNLYSPSMGSGYGGISRTGTAGNYRYDTIPGRENKAVNYVTFYDAIRFANWQHNGQPTGAPSDTTTESGSYTIERAGPFDISATRRSGATIVLTTEDEWYKAAYYNNLGERWEQHPGGCGNCSSLDVTDVGSFPGIESIYGTLDQGGNVAEFMEGVIAGQPHYRPLRGGSFGYEMHGGYTGGIRSSYRRFMIYESASMGFRLALIPEPSTGALVLTGIVCLAHRRRPQSGGRPPLRRWVFAGDPMGTAPPPAFAVSLRSSGTSGLRPR